MVLTLGGVDLEIQPGELLALVGPSGCGKSTLLAIVAGLLRPTQGEVRIDGRPVSGPGRDRGVVFQELAILPWRTVAGNVGHGLEIQKVPRPQREATVRRFVELVGLDGFEHKYPHELSGGMKQRVAVARALAANPDVLLMDEPLAAVDAQMRITLQEELLQIAAATRKTIMFVTHSVDEAVFLGDRVAVFSARPGRVKELVEVRTAVTQRALQDVVVTLQFPPEQFHIKLFQSYGTVSGVRGDAVIIRRVPPEAVSEIARLYWVRQIEPLR